MTTAIVKQELTPTAWGMIQQIARSAKDSGKLNLFKPEEAEMKMLVAWENGFPLTSAFGNVHIINNIPALSPKAVWAKVIVHPEFESYHEERLIDKKGDFLGYSITLKRKNGVTATRRFTLEDAKRAKLDQKDNWQAYQENMAYWRAIGFVEDVVFPDVTLGVARADDLGAFVDVKGDVVEGSWTVVQPSKPATSTAPLEQSLVANAINELVTQYSPEVFLEVTGGNLPTTMVEITELVEKLKAKQAERLNFTLNDLPEVKPA